jgi:hypothetical protein
MCGRLYHDDVGCLKSISPSFKSCLQSPGVQLPSALCPVAERHASSPGVIPEFGAIPVAP